MQTVNIHAAKTHFSRLIEEVEAGGEVVISRAGTPVAKLVPLGRSVVKPRRVLGQMAGQIQISADFDAPLPVDILESFDGR